MKKERNAQRSRNEVKLEYFVAFNNDNILMEAVQLVSATMY